MDDLKTSSTMKEAYCKMSMSKMDMDLALNNAKADAEK